LAEQNNAAFIWSIANLLRGTYKAADYGKVVLPFTVLRRLDSALEGSKQAVLEAKKQKSTSGAALDFILQKESGYSFYNTSPYDLKKAAGDTTNLKVNLLAYIEGFSPNVRDIFERYEFSAQLSKLDENDLLLLVTQKFSQIDLHPGSVSNIEMGLIFEELIRKFAEASNETAGEHFTPRDVVRLMVNILFASDDEVLSKPGVVRTIYDPTAGTGGMLSAAEDYIRHLNADARLTLFGQELNEESFAIAKADMVIKGQAIENMVWGDTLTNDGHFGKTFDYGLANPPFGVEWKRQRSFVENEHFERGFDGRFGPGLPDVDDGALLFLLHLVKKMRPVADGGSRVGIVLNGSSLFTGDAGSGASKIREYLFSQDLIETIIALPIDMFYNTSIATFIVILDNNKPSARKRKVQVIDASSLYSKLRKNLGDKSKEIGPDDVKRILECYSSTKDSEISKFLEPSAFGFSQVTVERPKRLEFSTDADIMDIWHSSKLIPKAFNDDLEQLAALLSGLSRRGRTFSRLEFTKWVSSAMAESNFKSPKATIDAICNACSRESTLAPPSLDAKGRVEPDKNLREVFNIPLSQDVEKFFKTFVQPFDSSSWIAQEKTKLGYKVQFKDFFFEPALPRDLSVIDDELDSILTQLEASLSSIKQKRANSAPAIKNEDPPVGQFVTGLEWLGAIPSDWEMVPLWSIFKKTKRLNHEDEELLALYRDHGVIPKSSRDDNHNVESQDLSKYQLVEPGDLVVNKMKAWQGSVAISTLRGIVSPAYFVYQPIREMNSRFMHHLLRSPGYFNQYSKLSSGVRPGQWDLDPIAFKTLGIPFPSLDVQAQIAATLDLELDSLQNLFEQATAITTVLNERRQSLISASTTGFGERKNG
jgi:type I restriction enzyme M protein